MNRRGFLGALIAAAVAPVQILRAGSAQIRPYRFVDFCGFRFRVPTKKPWTEEEQKDLMRQCVRFNEKVEFRYYLAS